MSINEPNRHTYSSSDSADETAEELKSSEQIVSEDDAKSDGNDDDKKDGS